MAVILTDYVDDNTGLDEAWNAAALAALPAREHLPHPVGAEELDREVLDSLRCRAQ